MGKYLNPGAGQFRRSVRSQIYVDKTEMLSFVNSVVGTDQCYLCVSRPRRFGKTMAANMLCAYYGRGTDARDVFEGLKIARADPIEVGGVGLAWDAYIGAFDVVRITVTEFFRRGKSVEDCLARMQRLVVRDFTREYPDADYFDTGDLAQSMQDVFDRTGRQFVVVIDEWDAPIRERRSDEGGQRLYLDFLRDWLKDREFVALTYMTGILPIKKYGAHSALNMFDEFSMAAPLQLASYTGFTTEEVSRLCAEYHRSFDDLRAWYDGYEVSGIIGPVEASKGCAEPPRWHLYSPLSVNKSVRTGIVRDWWSRTETYEALAEYIRMDYDGLKEAVAFLMDGGRLKVDLNTYQNDMATFHGRDDVFALLIHLGYLGFDDRDGTVFVPNREIMEEFRASTKGGEWEAPLREYEASKELLRETWAQNAPRVAELLEDVHDRAENKTYNSEAALSYAVQLAYYAAQHYYITVLELDSGKGYADVAYLPSPRHPDVPALLIELKWNKDAWTALDQVRNRNYPERLAHYKGNLLLVGVSYDAGARAGNPNFKRHRCAIERA